MPKSPFKRGQAVTFETAKGSKQGKVASPGGRGRINVKLDDGTKASPFLKNVTALDAGDVAPIVATATKAARQGKGKDVAATVQAAKAKPAPTKPTKLAPVKKGGKKAAVDVNTVAILAELIADRLLTVLGPEISGIVSLLRVSEDHPRDEAIVSRLDSIDAKLDRRAAETGSKPEIVSERFGNEVVYDFDSDVLSVTQNETEEEQAEYSHGALERAA